MGDGGNALGLNRVTLNVMGEDYIVTGNDTVEYIENIGRYLNEKIEEINKATGGGKLSKVQLAILAALQVADEYYKLRQEHEELLQLIKEAK
ncbi:MAG TPA: cell division protein ZapA [Firmicutes bacterium]|jgi:cell division protein ZapA|nr:cell division protein ZapA [Bacillota bacterium]HOQ24578.1 cell division protein ZapA [Bacillota bacterium]HPT67838.1 cell division protein ZapA [Bacillota bacterium]